MLAVSLNHILLTNFKYCYGFSREILVFHSVYKCRFFSIGKTIVIGTKIMEKSPE